MHDPREIECSKGILGYFSGTDHKVWKISGQYQLEAKNITMEELCLRLLSTEAQNTTVDQTGALVSYDFTLAWHRDGQTDIADSPDIFTAVKEQLGLQLVSRQIPESTLIVESINRPTAH